MNPALLIIDVQEAMITGGMYRGADVLANLQLLLTAARRSSRTVIHVRHDYGAGHEWARGTVGWQIYAPLLPVDGEIIIDKSRNSAFYRTDLATHLSAHAIDTLLISGVHTEYCIDATVRAAFDREFRVIVPELSNTTHGNEYLPAERLYAYYNHFMWPRRYASVLPLASALHTLTNAR